MSRPKQQVAAFLNFLKNQSSKQKSSLSAANQTSKEQQAEELIQKGKLREAETVYRELIEADTSNHVVYGNLASLCGMQGKLDEPVKLLHKALEIKPKYLNGHVNLGNILKDRGDLTAAIDSYNNALQINPNYPKAHNNLGAALQQQGDLTAAITCYTKALQLKPNYPEAHNNLGAALQELGNLKAAIVSYNKALELKPNDPKTHYNLGIALKDQGELSAAITAYKTALHLQPKFPDALHNIGVTFREKGELTAAIASFNAVLQLNPNDPDAHWNIAWTMLLGSDYKNGWEKYGWRTKKSKKPVKPHAAPKCDECSGNVALNQINQLLLVTEQGLGDTLQFMRYAAALKNKGISVSFCAQPKLHSLIQVSGIDPSPITPQQANQVSYGHWIPLLSVPRLLEVSPENPIITEPYIKTTDELNTKWSNILGAKENPIVGINWQGNPETEKGLQGRSLALETFAPVADCSKISLLSLQKGFGSEQLETCSFKDRFVSCQDQIDKAWDFLDTAAIIANCDLIITSDTAVAHLAGGMGKTTWLLLKKIPEWRWGLEGDTTFWYPSMRLFRQKERGNWDEVMKRVADALQQHYFGA